MAAEKDSNSSGFSNTVDSSQVTVAHTFIGQNVALVSFALCRTASNPSVTCNGVAMTLKTSQAQGVYSIFMFILSGATSGNVVLSKTNSEGGLLNIGLKGVHQVTSLLINNANNIAKSSTPSGTSRSDTVINNNLGDIAVDAFFDNNPTSNTPGSGQTKVNGPNFGPGLMDGSYKANGTTMSFTGSIAALIHIAASITQLPNSSLSKVLAWEGRVKTDIKLCIVCGRPIVSNVVGYLYCSNTCANPQRKNQLQSLPLHLPPETGREHDLRTQRNKDIKVKETPPVYVSFKENKKSGIIKRKT